MVELAWVSIIAAVSLSCAKIEKLGSLLAGASLFACALYPAVFAAPDSVKHVGIAGSVPQLSTYAIVMLAGFLMVGGHRSVRYSWPIVMPLILWMTGGLLFFWPATGEVWAGALQISIGIAGWFVGNFVGKRAILEPAVGRAIAVTAFGIIFAQLVLVLMQRAGIPVNAMDASGSSLFAGRFNGSMGHPNDLGKVVFLILAAALPFVDSVPPAWRRLIALGFVGGFAVLVFTGGRAVAISSLMLLCAWVLLAPTSRENLGRKATLLLTAALVSLGVIGTLLSRFDEDPGGGARDVLMNVAASEILQHPLTGVGLNSYVTVVGRSDSLTASGVPVHNALFLAAGEMGIPGAIALLVPFLLCLKMAWRLRSATTIAGSFARATLAASPGIALTAWTGWGLLGGSVLPLLFFVLGLLYSGMRSAVNVGCPTPLK